MTTALILVIPGAAVILFVLLIWWLFRLEVMVVNMVPAAYSGEIQHDSEPFLAVNPSNPELMVATAFTRTRTSDITGSGVRDAPIYVSEDGGKRWHYRHIIPSPYITKDITVAFNRTGTRLYSAFLHSVNVHEMHVASKKSDALDENSTMDEVPRGSVPDVHQPWIQVGTVDDTDYLYIGYMKEAPGGSDAARLDVSLDGGESFQSIKLERRGAGTFVVPSVRPTIADDGTVYVAFLGWRSWVSESAIAYAGAIRGTATSDVVVVRDDDWGRGERPFEDLVEEIETGGDGNVGVRVVTGIKIPYANMEGIIGNERSFAPLSIAVHPAQSNTVYIAWGDKPSDDQPFTVHLRRSLDRGETWSDDLWTVTDAPCFALAVTKRGTVGFLYQQYLNTSSNPRWVTRLKQFTENFVIKRTVELANVPANDPSSGTTWPYIGDYNFLQAVNDQFHGVFSTGNKPDLSHFPAVEPIYQRAVNFDEQQLIDGTNSVAVSIDPFYFRVSEMKVSW